MCNVEPSTVGRWLSGTVPRRRQALDLAAALKVDLAALAWGDDIRAAPVRREARAPAAAADPETPHSARPVTIVDPSIIADLLARLETQAVRDLMAEWSAQMATESPNDPAFIAFIGLAAAELQSRNRQSSP